MTLSLLTVALGLLALLCLVSAGREVRRRRVMHALAKTVLTLLMVTLVVAGIVVKVGLRAYHQVDVERVVGKLRFTKTGYHQYTGEFTFANGDRADFALRGDDWQLDARLLKWKAMLDLIGVDAVYRLDRISGRYTSIEDERDQPRTVYELHPVDHIDLWGIAHRYAAWLPGIDALYGSATYLPMGDGATYEVLVSRSGLIARPMNATARAAVGAWSDTQ